MTVDFVSCDLNDRAELEKLQVGSFQHVIVLSDDTYEAQHADARTLVTLLHLRDMQQKLGEHYSIVTEMNDDANREVAEVTKADDFVVSTKLISLYLTQLSENRQRSSPPCSTRKCRGPSQTPPQYTCNLGCRPTSPRSSGCRSAGGDRARISAARRRPECPAVLSHAGSRQTPLAGVDDQVIVPARHYSRAGTING